MRLSCKPQIIFCYIFSSLNVVNFWLDIENVYLVDASPTIFARLF